MSFLDGIPYNNAVTLDMDHWKIYGITAGPMLTFAIANHVLADCKLMGGIANARSPKIMYQGSTIAPADNNWAAAIQAGVNLRIQAGHHLFVFANTDYLYLKPRFSYTYINSSDMQVTKTTAQKMSVVNISAGIGINF